MGQVLFPHFTVRKMNSRKIKECLAQKKNKDLRMNKDLQILEGLISGGDCISLEGRLGPIREIAVANAGIIWAVEL